MTTTATIRRRDGRLGVDIDAGFWAEGFGDWPATAAGLAEAKAELINDGLCAPEDIEAIEALSMPPAGEPGELTSSQPVALTGDGDR